MLPLEGLRWDSEIPIPTHPAALRVSELEPSLAGAPEDVIQRLVADGQALRELVQSLRTDIKTYRALLSLALTEMHNLQAAAARGLK